MWQGGSAQFVAFTLTYNIQRDCKHLIGMAVFTQSDSHLPEYVHIR